MEQWKKANLFFFSFVWLVHCTVISLEFQTGHEESREKNEEEQQSWGGKKEWAESDEQL